MKRRIISSILVVVMLVLSLVGCGYSYTKDDLSQYATFDKAAFDAALQKLVIEDGDFTTDEATRDLKVLDSIYEVLVKEVDTKDTEAQIKEGMLDKNDLLYYCYYATYVKDGKTVVVYPSKMKVASAVSIKLGLSDLDDDVLTLIKDAVYAAIGEDGEVEIKDYVYSTTASGAVEKDDVVYVSYTSENASGTKTTYKFERLTVGDETNPVAKELLGGTEKNANPARVGTALTEFTNGKEGEELVKYTNVKVDWIVDTEKEITTEPYKLDKELNVTDVVVGTSDKIAAETELTYHVYPIYYYEVEEFSAEAVIETLIESLSKDSLECLKDCEELIKTYADKVKAKDTAVTAFEKAEEAIEKADKALAEAKTAAEKKGKEEGKEGDALTAYVDADAAVVAAKTAVTEANKDLNEKKKPAKETAEADVTAAMNAIFKKVGADDEAAGKTKVEEEYKETIHDKLVEEYNTEIKNNLAKAIWDLMVANTKVTGYPEKGVDEVYDRMYDSHKYTFYTGTDSSTKESHYKANKGDFKAYFTKTMGAANYKAAKEELRKDAEEYVADFIVIYYVAEQYDLMYDKKEIKEYKNDEEGNYSYNEYYQGETNALAAYQFDKLLNHFLESETDEETKAVTYKKIAFTLKEATEDSSEKEDDDHSDHDHE